MQIQKRFSRWGLILASLLIISLILWNTFIFFNQLKENERVKMSIFAQAYQELQHQFTEDAMVGEMVLTVIQSNTTTPMILYTHKEEFYTDRNIALADVNTLEKKQKLIEQFSSEYTPIEIRNNEDELLSTIYYGNSPLINKLKYYPLFLILIIFLFILAIYLFYKTSKSSEQNKLWAGMAKETAHQIGTPLSSLIGWIEILKTEDVDPDYIVEMEKDILRFEMITDRFSKIGSIPILERSDIVKETRDSYLYLQSRTSKLIDFELNIPEDPIYVNLNPQLYSWTIENLVKNGIDAMRGKGKITISIKKNAKFVLIHISDTGKGLTKSQFKKIFSPGYTTKKRGWGLGLSLAYRIIREYHNGRIRVIKSVVGEGTTMEISLRIEN